eukprot:3377433-Pyramimonas_sp.AAC.1
MHEPAALVIVPRQRPKEDIVTHPGAETLLCGASLILEIAHPGTNERDERRVGGTGNLLLDAGG